MKRKNLLITMFMFVFFAVVLLFNNNSYAGNTTVDALKSKFPAGKFWNHYAGYDHYYYNGIEDSGSCNNPDGYTSTECAYHNGTTASYGQADCNSFNGGQECAGFARKLFYDYYGQYATNMSRTYDKNSIKPGDVVRYEGDGALSGGHEVWVIGVDSEKLIVGECNWYKRCEISWDRWVYKSNISIDYIMPAPYAIDDNAKDTESPSITDFFVNTVSTTSNSILVRAKATDNVGVTKMKFRVWRCGNSADSGTTKWGSYNSSAGCWEVSFSESDTKIINDDLCCVEAWAYDAEGNQSASKAVYNFVFGKRVSGLGNFTARIVYKANTNYCIGVSGSNNGDDLKLKAKSQSDTSQLWKFEELSTGIYKITNVQNGKSIDIEGGTSADSNGCNMQVWSYSGASQNQFLIQNYNGGYRIVPTNTREMRGIDLKDRKDTDNSPIILYQADLKNNAAQTWVFEKVATSLRLSATSTSVRMGASKSLSATITPSTVANKNLTWSSSDTSVVTVSSSGTIKGVKMGTATIKAKTTDGSNKTATCKVTVTLPFTDVSTNDWYYTAVEYTYKKGIILGTSDTTFNPNTKLTRGMLVTILHRMEGKPVVNVENKFKDVYKSQYYYNAVKWAAANGIVHGYDNGKFGPDNTITRQDVAVILRNYAQYKGKNTNVTTDLTKFKDGNIVSNYAKTAMQWAVGKGVITGNSDNNTLTPHATSTRAEAASMLYKYCTKVK